MEDTPQGPNDSAPPPPPPAEPEPVKETAPAEVVSDNRNIMIVLSYLGLLALIPLLVEWVGWQWAFALLALGPIFGVWAMWSLGRSPAATLLAGGRG